MKKILLKPIGFKVLRQHICNGFMDDVELLERNAHKAHASYDEMVDVNLVTIIEASEDYGVSLFAVLIDHGGGSYQSIGFTVLMKEGQGARLLYSFGINIAWRRKEVLLEWLKAVEKEFGDKRYGVSLYLVNSRAINFFKKNGFVNEKVVNNQQILLWQSQQQQS